MFTELLNSPFTAFSYITLQSSSYSGHKNCWYITSATNKYFGSAKGGQREWKQWAKGRSPEYHYSHHTWNLFPM